MQSSLYPIWTGKISTVQNATTPQQYHSWKNQLMIDSVKFYVMSTEREKKKMCTLVIHLKFLKVAICNNMQEQKLLKIT